MKDFAKKLISTAMALVLTASMSVYAEDVTSVEGANGSVLAAVNGVTGCGNHVTFRNDEYKYKEGSRVHDTEKGICHVTIQYYRYDLICMKCHETVGHVDTKMVETHSITHS